MKKRKLLVAIVAGILAVSMLLGLVLSVLPVAAHAAKTSSEIQTEIDALQEKQAEIQSQMEQLQGEMDENRSETENIVKEKSNIDQQIGLLYAKMENINQQIDAYNVLIADKQEELTAAEIRLADLSEKNKDRIRAMEEDGGLSYWSVLFKANSFPDLLDRLNMIEEIAAADRRRIKELSDAAREVADVKETLAAEKAGLEQSQIELAESQTELDAKRLEANELLAELVAEAQRLDNDMFDYEAKTEELLAQLGAAQAEYDNAKYLEWLATSETTTEPPTKPGYNWDDDEEEEEEPTQPGEDDEDPGDDEGDDDDYVTYPSGEGWIIPCNYTYMSSAFGWREPPTEGASTFHSGVDLAGPEGTPIWSCRSGVVTRAGYNEYNGYFVEVDHGDGFASVYLHMTHYTVDVGEYVSQGETIGAMGSTGISTGPHLHLTIYYYGSPVNPADYIDFY